MKTVSLFASEISTDYSLFQLRNMQSSETTKFFETRARAEEQATGAQSTKDKLHAFALKDLLDARKGVTSPEELARLAGHYGMSAGKLESVSRYISSPSIFSEESVKVVDSDGEEQMTTRVSLTFCSLIFQD